MNARIQAPVGGAYSVDNHFYEGGQFMPDGVKTSFGSSTKKSIKKVKAVISGFEFVAVNLLKMNVQKCFVVRVATNEGNVPEASGLLREYSFAYKKEAIEYATQLAQSLEIDLIMS